MSYKSDGGRIPRLRDFGDQARNASTPTIAVQSNAFGLGASLPRPQIPRLMTPSTKSRRAASMSDAEENRPLVAQSSPLLTPNPRPYMAPRTPTHPPPSQSPRNTTLDRHVPRTLHTPVLPQTPIDNRLPVQSRPRNVLRRKAPTIGQHNDDNRLQMKSVRPGGLNVIIPNSMATGHSQPSSFQSTSQTELVTEVPSPMVPHNQPTISTAEQQSFNGPKELASLRTIINTQNLPPFTPIFPSASTPSTRYSGSPGVWSRTSNSTPASLSSCSPGIVQPMKVGLQLRQPSPSHTRLPVFSPQTQKHSLPSSPAAGKSPNLVPGYGSTTSLLSEGRENRTEKPDIVKSSPSPSLLPRRTSINSNLPRQVKKSPDTHPRTEKIETRQTPDSAGAVVTRTAPKPPRQIPIRPSREGTSQLDLEPFPVVKTNITPRALKGHKRRISAESTPGLASNQSAAASVDSLNSLASSRIRSPTSPELARKSPRTLTKEPPNVSPPDISPAKSRRFGLFPRKSKPELDARQSENRPARKGPAAGTGHEGYGKYAQRGRKSSVSSPSDSRARSTSTTKSVSSKGSSRSRADTELDDFFLERLEPVYINGGGVDDVTLSRTQSEQSTGALSTKSVPGPGHNPAVPPPGYHYESSAASKGATLHKESHRRDLSSPATTFASGSRIKVPTLPSPDRSKSRQDVKPTQIAPRRNWTDNTTSHAPSQPQMKKPSKRGLNLKWPFFQKELGPGLSAGEEHMSPASQLPAQVSAVGVRRPVAHYAFVDTDSDPLEKIFHNLEDSPPTEEDDDLPPVEVPAGLKIRKPHESILLPSPPTLHSEFPVKRSAPPKFDSSKEMASPKHETTPEERPSRLASVGRIPRVVSRRDRQHRPALQSFSRPFSVAESPSLTALVTDQSHGFSSPNRHALGPHSDTHHRSEKPGFDLTSPFGNPMKGGVLDFLAGPYSKHEFLAFSPRKDSTSSGSESLAAITAVVPGPGADLTEDEIWGEYDEFIDHVFSPETPSLLFPREQESREKFELAARASRALQAGLNSKLAVSASPEQPTVSLTPASPRTSVNSIRLRRSKIANALHSSLSPTSQPSVSDMLARFRDDQDEVSNTRFSTKVQTPSITVEQPPSSLLSSPSLDPSPSFENYRQRNTILFDIAERDREGPTAQTNIRSGSLMTSRWLSFGRVLFSPAHKHVKNGEQERILVVDGLANDDWSFYCALTYPNADVYCLHEGLTPTASKHPAAWRPPSNHHTIHHASLEDPVPFPKGFFAVTVLRFPAACSEAAQNNIVSECKRVLRPGGYLEMSILDHDMENMGVRTRRAVRKLKETMYLSDASISLKPASDNIQKLLGRHGFDNLRRCMVRIPVAGMIVRSSASSSSTSSSNPSMLTAAVTSSTALSATSGSSTGQRSNTHEKSSSNDTVLSLGDLLSDPSPSPSNDESIRKIVARVGRWWYTRCYESPVLPNGDVDRSIWADRKVLRECQQRGTGFRLLIAYTQKPSEKRRTASV
ncbi:hypothetical protein BDW59DRAFT_18866 [Aspergillus cavernicola]|uniref:Methyltransferase type 11 domain-containing protein n=1 Tax=Aspergillus cavernicola TaxID=176166 RepID=A0ABR4IS28_9EURO